jgi:hypothetical protein
MATTALRPLSLGELLDRTFFLYRKYFLLFVGIVAVPHLLLLAFQLVNVSLRPTRFVVAPMTNVMWSLASLLIYLPVLAASQGATVVAVSRVHLGEQTTVGESLSILMQRIIPVSLIMFGIGLVLFFGLLLLVVPGIIYGLMWALWLPVTVLENTGFWETTSRSSELTKGSRGRIFVIFFLFIVLTYMVYMLWEVPILAALGMFQRGYNPIAGFPRWFLIAAPIGTFFTSCLVSPLLTIALALTYYDQKVRKEGFDLQLMMSSLDAPQGEAAPGTTPVTT